MRMIHRISGYETSRDYERLADEMQRRSVVCIVDSYSDCRDIAKTIYSDSKDGDGTWQISSRGHGYVYADSRDQFVRQCIKLNVEALF